MNPDITQPQRRAGRASRAIRVLLTVAALTAVGLSLGGCYGQVCGFEGNEIKECW